VLRIYVVAVELERRSRRWSTSLQMVGSTSGLMPAAGVPSLRLLA
jgi:hypothetical protein